LLAVLVLTTGFVWGQVGGGITSSAGAFTGGPPGLKGVPYSADVINETTRVLADGNRIHQETHGRQFRDSQGRTRSEIQFPMMPGPEIPFQNVSITDPVQGVFINLDSRSKTATIHHFNLPSTLPGNAAAGSQASVSARVEDRETVRSEDLGTTEIEGFQRAGNVEVSRSKNCIAEQT
jgi:hypothetical protein